MKFKQIIDRIEKGWGQGGFTISIRDDCDPSFAENEYLVGLRRRERRWKHKPTPAEIVSFLFNNKPWLDREDYHLGGWQDNGWCYFGCLLLCPGQRTGQRNR
jgi:hypothetical protein